MVRRVAEMVGTARRLGAVLLLLVFARAASAQETVEVPPGRFSSSPGPLVGHVFEPHGAGPHPAVVMMHGCGGAYARNGDLNARHRMWGEYLASRGYVALMLDSFTSRGVKQVCTQKLAERTLRPRDRVGDAYAALAWLRARKDVDAKRVALLGWSHGGSTVLEAIRQAPAGPPGFDAAVAFYPGCSAHAKAAERFHPYAPLLVIMGEADDWTPARPCQALDQLLAQRGERMELVTYPGTYHDFDNPALKRLHVRKDVPNGVNPGRGVTTAPNAEAREDAKRRVAAFLAKVFATK